jgi:TetR/AcrR family transcriptional repressor of mexJK operon
MTTQRVVGRSGRVPAALLEEHEAALLEAARSLFYEHGFEGTSIETIARLAHVSPKTIYTRFGSKQGLLAACIGTRSDEVHAALKTPFVSGEDVRSALIKYGTLLLTVTSGAEAVRIQRLVIAETTRFPELGEAVYAAGPGRVTNTLATFFARATAEGLLRVPDPDAAAEMFAGALLGVPMRDALLRNVKLSPAVIAAKAKAIAGLFVSAYAA